MCTCLNIPLGPLKKNELPSSSPKLPALSEAKNRAKISFGSMNIPPPIPP
uniref:Uncharacterized protein n=1 Tax=Cryptosporidium parvum TaxID=5807 RepID=F0X5V8_CRYPV